jgi:ankyrin repeat protein
MYIRAMVLAGLLVSSLAGAASAAETSNLSLVDATRQGDREAARSLLNSHADVNVAGADGMTALMWAAYNNDVQMADLLLRARANVNAANDYGATALMPPPRMRIRQ